MGKQRKSAKQKRRSDSDQAHPTSHSGGGCTSSYAKIIVFFRHGESLSQAASDKSSRRTDPKLTDCGVSGLGKKQAHKLAQNTIVTTAPFQLAVCSPLTRSIQTCCIALKDRRDVPVVCCPLVSEVSRDKALFENIGRTLREVHDDPEVNVLPRFRDVDFSLVDANYSTDPHTATTRWWEARELIADSRSREDRLRLWLSRRPERVICVSGHGRLTQKLLGTTQHVANCKLFFAGLDAKGNITQLDAQSIDIEQQLRTLAALPIPRQPVNSSSAKRVPAPKAATPAIPGNGGGSKSNKKLTRRERKLLAQANGGSQGGRSTHGSKSPNFVLLVGLPGSGKSTFVDALLRRKSHQPCVVNIAPGASNLVNVQVVGLPWPFHCVVEPSVTTIGALKAAVASQTGLRPRDIALFKTPKNDNETTDEDVVLCDEQLPPGTPRRLFAKLVSLSKRDFAGATNRVVRGHGPSSHWVCVSQDIVSSSTLTASLLPVQVKKHGQKVIFDNCNVDARSRRQACELAMVPPEKTHVVFFDTSVDECVERVNGSLSEACLWTEPRIWQL